jgi:hypothetical protein
MAKWATIQCIATPSLPACDRDLTDRSSACRPAARALSGKATARLPVASRRSGPAPVSRRALHVVNYVAEHAPVAYKDLVLGK